VIVDLAHHAKLVASDKEPQDLVGEADMVGFVTEHELLLGTFKGSLQLHDTTTQQRSTLVERDDDLIGIAWSRGRPVWVAAVFKDLTLWRKELGGREASTTRLPRKPTSSLSVGADGTVLFAVEKALMAWTPTDTVQQHATLPKPIIELGTTGTDKLVAFTDAGAAYLVDTMHADQVANIDQTLGRTKVSMSADTGMMVVAERGALDVIDPLVDHPRWSLASAPGVTYSTPQVSTDGRRVLAQSTAGLLLWTLALPQGGDETSAWLDQMSNAITGSGPKSLGWR